MPAFLAFGGQLPEDIPVPEGKPEGTGSVPPSWQQPAPGPIWSQTHPERDHLTVEADGRRCIGYGADARTRVEPVATLFAMARIRCVK